MGERTDGATVEFTMPPPKGWDEECKADYERAFVVGSINQAAPNWSKATADIG
jgi:hypothetical protein